MARRNETTEDPTNSASGSFDYTENNSRTIQFGDLQVPCRNRFYEGQRLEGESLRFANATYADVVRQGFYNKYKAMTEEGKDEQEILDAWYEHDANYVWSPRSRGVALSPLDQMKQKVAKEVLQAQLNAIGKKLKGSDPDLVQEMIAKIIELDPEGITAKAQARLDDLQKPIANLDFSAFQDMKSAEKEED